MKKILLYLMLLLSAFVINGCAVYYPDEYYSWSVDRRAEWCRQHPHGWFGYYRESPGYRLYHQRTEEHQQREEHEHHE